MSREVSLHIEELVLHGFNRADRYVITEAIEQELSRLLGDEPGGPANTSMLSSKIRHADAGEFQVERPLRANTVGIQIAKAVYGVLNN